LADLSDPKQHKWRQGALLPAQTPGLVFVSRTPDPPLTDADALLLVSHDCDICCKDPEEEPVLELIPVRRVADLEVDQNLLAGRSPRRLQIRLDDEIVYSLLANERLWVRRELLKEIQCTQAVSRETLQQLRRWLRRRYDRTSLPTELVDRMRKAERVLHKKLKAHGEPVCSVWLSVDPETELNNDEAYTVEVYLAMPVDEYSKPDKLKQTRETAASVSSALASCVGISSEGVRVVSEAEITLDDLYELIRWDLDDYLSYREENPNLSPAI
jgi:hypothetical protein